MSDENKKTVEEPDFEQLAKTTAPSKFNKFVTLILVAICVVLAAFIIYRMMTTASDTPVQSTVQDTVISSVNVSAEPAAIRDFSRISRFNGEVRRSGDSIAVYPDITSSGVVTQILVSRGDAINAGVLTEKWRA